MPERPDDWIAALWDQVRPSAAAKVAVIARAAEAARHGRLEGPILAEAWQEAHRLAGSLGTYGQLDAAEAAAELEQMLDGPAGPPPADRLAVLVGRLEAAVDTPPSAR